MGFLNKIKSYIFPVKNYRAFKHVPRSERAYWQTNSLQLDNIFNRIATDVAMSEFSHVVVREVDGLKTYEKQELSDLTNVLSVSPNKLETPIIFWSRVVRNMLENGVVVVLPVFISGRIQSLKIIESSFDYDDNYIYFNSEGLDYTLSLDDVWIFENPKSNISNQLGQITRLINDALRAISERVNEHDKDLSGLLKFPTKIQDGEMKARAESRVSNILDVAKKGGIGYLDAGEEFQELKNTYGLASKEELEFLKGQLYEAFGLNEHLFTCDYTEEQYRAYVQSVLSVYIRSIQEEISRKYFTRTARTQGHRLIYKLDMYAVSSLKDLTSFFKETVWAGILNTNECREIIDKSGYIGGDIFRTNSNAVDLTSGGGENNENEGL
jgi:HK97 family phage portal protein